MTVADAPPHVVSTMSAPPLTWLALIVGIVCSGCASVPYKCGNFHDTHDDSPAEIAFEYGKPQKFLDDVAWLTGIWSRVLTMNTRVNTHELSEENKEKLIAYLKVNELDDVLVRVNQYDPKGEWRRLRENERIGLGWRYSVGLLSMAHYTLLPGRVLGGDQYNPFTNTLSINSDVAAVALHEAAYAKDIHSRQLPGSYAVINEFPILSLWRHTTGVNDVIGYAQTNDDWMIEHETYRVVYPQIGIHTTAGTGPLMPFWDGILVSVAGATCGHATGQMAISQRTSERKAKLEDRATDEVTTLVDLRPNPLQKRPSSGNIQFTNHETTWEDE